MTLLLYARETIVTITQYYQRYISKDAALLRSRQWLKRDGNPQTDNLQYVQPPCPSNPSPVTATAQNTLPLHDGILVAVFLGSQPDVILEIQLRLRVALAWLEIDNEVMLHSEYGIRFEILVVGREDLRGDGGVAFCGDLACNNMH
jgi:hypothetical protein